MLKAGMNEVRDVLGISFVLSSVNSFLKAVIGVSIPSLHSVILTAQRPEIGVESFDHFILLSY